MSEIIENYFNLNWPEAYGCTALGYDSRSHLGVRARTHPEIGPNFLIIFRDIKYFKCPISWRGANFFRKDPTEYFEFLVRLGYVEESPLHGSGYYLFEASLYPSGRLDNTEELTDHKVRILAGSASISEI